MDNSNYFSINNLDELSGIADHLSFAEQLIDKYSNKVTEVGNWSIFKEQVMQIRKKQNDKKLNLSIIGEFSTGKSTFINALLGKELLVSSAMQGTTVASTIIDYSNHYKICIQYLDYKDHREEFSFSNFEDMRDKLNHYTTEETIAKQLASVHVSLPAKVVKNNFRIIDTPGTNVTEAWHESVTIRTIKEMSDLSIILVSAEKPAPDTMLYFVQNHLSSILPQCIFVVTKLDSIRPKERQGLLDYIKIKLEGELELENAVVLPYASLMVLEEALLEDSGRTKKEDTILLEQSHNTEKKLFEHMATQRAIAQTKKLTRLIDTMYQSISMQMGQIADNYEKKLSLLERTKQTNLEVFVRKEKEKQFRYFDEKTKEMQDQIEDKLYGMAESAKLQILSNLDKKTSIDSLKDYINGTLSRDCSTNARIMVSAAEDYYGPIQEEFKREMKSFEKAFQKLYKTLNILPINMSQAKYNLPASIQVETANLTSAANYIAEELSSENKAFFGGAAAGAAIGTMLFPGIGTLIGGFVGLVGGAAVAPDTDKVRDNCKEKLLLQLNSYYNLVFDNAVSAVEHYISQIKDCLSDEIDKYLKTYHQEVEKQIKENRNQKESVVAKVNDLKRDMSYIQTRKTQLNSVMDQLNFLGKRRIYE